jgi:hypothetical protein
LASQVERETLIDIDLLIGEFRRAVARALVNCACSTAQEFVVSRKRESGLARASAGGD